MSTTGTTTTEQKILQAVSLSGLAIATGENVAVCDAIRAIVAARGALAANAPEHDALAALAQAVCAAGKRVRLAA